MGILNQVLPQVRQALSKIVFHERPTVYEWKIIESVVLAAVNGHLELSKRIRPTKTRAVDGLLTCEEAAQRLNVSTKTLRRWCARKKIPFVQYDAGGPIHFEPSDVENFKLRHKSAMKEPRRYVVRKSGRVIPNIIPEHEWGDE